MNHCLSYRTAGRGLLTSSILVSLLLLASYIEATAARSLTSNDYFRSLTPDNIYDVPLAKRNTWWTKKSLNAMDTVSHSNIESGLGKCQDTVEVYSCYVGNCVQSFVQCSRHADTDDLFAACNVLHKLCASRCSPLTNQDEWLKL